MRNRGFGLHEDADTALEMAVTRVHKYKSHPQLLPQPLEFTQKVVLDALALAPTPVGDAWMACTLAAVSGLARWAHSTGQPLTREHLLGEETRYRYIEWAAKEQEWVDGSKNLNWLRLELIGDFLLDVTPGRVMRKPTITEEAPLEPLTGSEQADVWIWARSLTIKTRKQRVTATIALGLGCGLTGGEIVRVSVDDVVLDPDGSVHVWVLSDKTGQRRLVTCLADWEDRLAQIALSVEPGHFLTTPWRVVAPDHGAANESLRRAMKKNPPMLFNCTRLRNTWLCWHLANGTPLKELMQAADMKEANHLHNLLPLLPDTDAVRSKRVLRGTRTVPTSRRQKAPCVALRDSDSDLSPQNPDDGWYSRE